jgi:hypothetical protein
MRRVLISRGGALVPFLVLLAAMLMVTPVQASGRLVPFRATYHENVTFTPCGATIVCVDSHGVGLATHLGKSTDVNTAGTVDFSTSPCATVFTPLATLIAANGDTITTTLSGFGCPTSTFGLDTLSGTFTITGGTGRFAGATGGGTLFGLSQIDTSCFCRATTTLSFNGKVSAPGSGH